MYTSNCLFLLLEYYKQLIFLDAHEQMATLDVLVCGQCHSAFHFIEEFKEHKESKDCSGKSPVRDSVCIIYNTNSLNSCTIPYLLFKIMFSFNTFLEWIKSTSMGISPVEVFISPWWVYDHKRQQLEAVSTVVSHGWVTTHRLDYCWGQRTGPVQVCSC